MAPQPPPGPVPRLVDIAPAIFLPIPDPSEENLFAPPPSSPDPATATATTTSSNTTATSASASTSTSTSAAVDEAKRQLAAIDRHEGRVRERLQGLYSLERERIASEAKDQDARRLEAHAAAFAAAPSAAAEGSGGGSGGGGSGSGSGGGGNENGEERRASAGSLKRRRTDEDLAASTHASSSSSGPAPERPRERPQPPPLPEIPRGAPFEEVDAIIESMSAPPPTSDDSRNHRHPDRRGSSSGGGDTVGDGGTRGDGASSNAPQPTIPLPVFDSSQARTPREWAALETMGLMSRALKDLQRFDEHIRRLKAPYEQVLERELRRGEGREEAAAGGGGQGEKVPAGHSETLPFR